MFDTVLVSHKALASTFILTLTYHTRIYQSNMVLAVSIAQIMKTLPELLHENEIFSIRIDVKQPMVD